MKRIYKALWEELRLDPKFRSMFELCNITTVSDLLQRKRYGLLKTKNVGTGTLNRLELILAKSRLHLQPGPKKRACRYCGFIHWCSETRVAKPSH